MASNLPTKVPTPTTTPNSASLLYIVDSPYSSPSDNATTVANAVTKGHGLSDGYAKVSSSVLTTGTIAQADLPVMTGDTGSGGIKGAVPAPAAGDAAASKYLKANGTWATIGGGGDMLKSTYDTDNTGIVDNAESISIIARNATGSTLYQGTIVYISGATGNRPNIVKAKADTQVASAQTFGVVLANISNNTDGQVLTIGAIDTLDTRTSATNPFTSDTLAAGDVLYLSPTTAGYVTNVKPTAPNHMVYVGIVTRTGASNGTIVYRVQNGYELGELHNVSAASPSNKNSILYNTSTTLWEARAIAATDIDANVSNTEFSYLDGVTSAIQTQINAKEGTITAGTTGQYYRGDKTFQTLDKTAVGLGNVDNTSDANKPVSTATQTALDAKRTLARVTFSDANYTITATKDVVVAQTGTLTAARTVTLPLANSVTAGTEFMIQDVSGSVTSTNTIIIARAGSDTINGATSDTMVAGYGWRRLTSDGTSKWNFDAGVLRISYLDTDGTLAANSDSKLATQKATKTYADTKTDKATLTTKGDIYVASGASTPIRLGVGTNGQALIADSTQTGGVKWATSTASSTNVYNISLESTLATGNGALRLPIMTTCTIVDVRAMVGGVPTGSSIIVDVNKNGTTIFTTQANRPTIAVSANDSGAKTPDVTSLVAGDYITADIDQVGSSFAGSDIAIAIRVTI
jgi:hypothetical protein